ncbi:MAG: hypothetical protein ABIC04_07180 [Nanoarchaeota archaeon]
MKRDRGVYILSKKPLKKKKQTNLEKLLQAQQNRFGRKIMEKMIINQNK